MFKEIVVHAHFNERTGYGVHASRFFPELDALVQKQTGGEGTVHISLLDTVTASQTTERHPTPSILYNVWESTEQPTEFINKLKLYDQLWVPSEWQRAASIAQGIPEEFVKVVPEGVDPETYKPGENLPASLTFNFVHVGQWQPRKSTKEIVGAFLKAFPDTTKQRYPTLANANANVRLYLSADTLFPSDNYKSTEERLDAYGFNDSRIIVVHFEERQDYIRRLQSAHCFVSCSRSEGWGLPIIEAMACGVPTIVADFGGSTEYAGDALLVRVPELRKPHGIYGGWDVPGQWGEPDYNHLVEVMRDAYDNYSKHKAKALITSTTIRTKFSWKAAAQKAYGILGELSGCPVSSEVKDVDNPIDKEKEIRLFARKYGFEIDSMHKRKAIFCVDCHPTSQEKMDTLVETISQIKALNYPVLVTSHCALPAPIIELADYYIYDKKDVLSGDDRPTYFRTDGEGKKETGTPGIPCHALAAIHNVRNAVDFCLGKYEWIYQMSSDAEVDLADWIEKVHASDKKLICINWETNKESISGQIMASTTEIMDKITPHIETWEEFARIYGEHRFCSEKKGYQIVAELVGLENVEFLNIPVGNRFNQVDMNVWKDDLFQCHFVEGPFLHINGISDREYDVTYTTPQDGNVYGVKQKVGMWSRPTIKYYKDWTIRAHLNGELKYEHKLDLKDKRVLICFGSKALGDTIAWMPYVEEFRKKHGCHVVCSGWWTDIFDYPEIEFVHPGSAVDGIYASYDVGCFDDQLDKNVKNWRLTNLQQVSADILGLEYKPIRAKLKYQKPKRGNGHPPKPYICFSEFSTMKNKFWNREGAWQKVIDYLNAQGYECVSISAEKTQLKNVTSHNGQLIQDTINDISGAEFYIGLNAGPSWIAIALDIPCILISGVSEAWNDFPNPHRIAINNKVCGIGCFNDPSFPIDRGFSWCPRNKDYICTKKITETMVIDTINKVVGIKKQKIKTTRKKKEQAVSIELQGGVQ
jgi:autotransporter strand-loop-strand O-heptosyltransferase